jgi:hypothetical protein
MKQNKPWIAVESALVLASALAGGMIGSMMATQLNASGAVTATHHR